MKLEIQRLDKSLPMPSYKHKGDAGMDICSREDCVIHSGERKLVATGLKVAIPLGYELQIRPRSGLALKNGITLLNSPGTIDHEYRGEIGVIMINHGKETFEIKKGDRIAQMVFSKFETAELEEAEELSQTTRGEGGFGSTGKR